MVIEKQANDDFERARSKAFWRKVITWLTGRSNQLLPFDEVRERLPIQGQADTGLQQVPISQIIGSIGRYHDFDRAFLPRQSRTKGRWVNIDKAHYQQVDLPPIELYKMGEIYFVRDGNHRVSVARERGQEYIDAHVIEIRIPVTLTSETTLDDLDIKQEYADFINKTSINELFPLADFTTCIKGQYAKLLEHIDFHRWLLGAQREHPVDYTEAVSSWYQTVYLPIIEALKEQGLLNQFPNSSEVDLYLMIVKYQWHLIHAYRDEQPGEDISQQAVRVEAARQLTAEERWPDLKKLIRVLQQSEWLEDLVLSQEKRAFDERTLLSLKFPMEDIQLSVLGQYDKLLEHISVHRWYLGEHHKGDVTYQEAAESWFINVYQPLVQIIRNQKILDSFSGRTEADLYLWVMSHRDLENFWRDDPQNTTD
jgi:hypothetical protein